MENWIWTNLLPYASKPWVTCSQSGAYFINKGLNVLFPNIVDDMQIIVLCTDAALCMLATSPLLKVFYAHLIHVTCLAYGINWLAKLIRNELFRSVQFYFKHEESMLERTIQKSFQVAHYDHSLSWLAGIHGLRQLNVTERTLKLLKKLFGHFLAQVLQLV